MNYSYNSLYYTELYYDRQFQKNSKGLYYIGDLEKNSFLNEVQYIIKELEILISFIVHPLREAVSLLIL